MAVSPIMSDAIQNPPLRNTRISRHRAHRECAGESDAKVDPPASCAMESKDRFVRAVTTGAHQRQPGR
eukprot:4916367-Prymnesium_polylepis.1